MSHDHTFVSGEVLTAANINDLTSGRVGYAEVTANQSGITSITDVTSLSITFTAIASRYYKITAFCLMTTTVGTDRLQIAITDGSNNVLSQAVQIPAETSATVGPWYAESIKSPGAGSVTYKVRAARVSGSGTVQVVAASTSPAFILVEDIGSS